jgi:hypothetical protein
LISRSAMIQAIVRHVTDPPPVRDGEPIRSEHQHDGIGFHFLTMEDRTETLLRLDDVSIRVDCAAGFDGMPFTVVAQTLSRLDRKGVIQRIGKGLYDRLRQTTFGPSRPNMSRIRSLVSPTFAPQSVISLIFQCTFPISVMSRHVPLDVRLAGSEGGVQNGEAVRVDQIGAGANISKIKFWKYF